MLNLKNHFKSACKFMVKRQDGIESPLESILAGVLFLALFAILVLFISVASHG